MEVDRHADKALYLQLADVLRDDIIQGRLEPGKRLPSESELIDRHGVSRGTAREAIAVLRNEGLLVVEHGRGAFVRTDDHEPLTRQTTATGPHMRARHNLEQLAADAGRTLSIRDLAPPNDMQPPTGLGNRLPKEATLEGAVMLCFADGRPISVTRTWEVSAVPDVGDSVEETVVARMPTREERRLLQLDDGTPVLLLDRVLFQAGEVLELSSSVIPASRQHLTYRL